MSSRATKGRRRPKWTRTPGNPDGRPESGWSLREISRETGAPYNRVRNLARNEGLVMGLTPTREHFEGIRAKLLPLLGAKTGTTPEGATNHA